MADAVLHISADFPDAVSDAKPQVVRRLLELTAHAFDHRAISINRRSPDAWSFAGQLVSNGLRPAANVAWHDGDSCFSLTYDAPAKGLFHKRMLHTLGDSIVAKLRDAPRPALVVGHKLSIEGLVAERIARHFGVPFALVIQGNSDGRILAARPDLARDLQRLFHGASVVFAYTPWSLRLFERKFGARAGPALLLPCPTPLDQTRAPQLTDRPQFVTAFHLRNRKVKNLAGMAKAMRVLAKDGARATLEVIGGGDDADVTACEKIVRTTPSVGLLGHREPAELPPLFNRATGFILPSLRESFGLVFVEALFAGTPIIYPRGTAVDGWFDGVPFALPVDPHDPRAIAGAMQRLIETQSEAKAALREWQGSTQARQFTRAAIGQVFTSGLRAGIG